jgi:hypothetical protein
MSRTDWLKPCDVCCLNCGGSTDTSDALLRGETKRFGIYCLRPADHRFWQNEANFLYGSE